MTEFKDIESVIPSLTLTEKLALKLQLDDLIHGSITLSSAESDREQIEEMERRVEGYLNGDLVAQSAEIALAEIRRDLDL